jgi:TCP-1/cpn60 chaperonin family
MKYRLGQNTDISRWRDHRHERRRDDSRSDGGRTSDRQATRPTIKKSGRRNWGWDNGRRRCVDLEAPSCIIRSLLRVPVLAGALLEQSEALLDKGVHPIRIADGFDRACAVAVAHLDKISDTIEYSKENTANLLKASMTSLGSKMCVLLSPLSFHQLYSQISSSQRIESTRKIRPDRRRRSTPSS